MSIIKREFVPHLDVLVRLADTFLESTSLKKTHIHFASKVSWASYDRYLEWLKKRNYIEPINDGYGEKYRLTEEGREMFHIVLKFKEILKLKTLFT